jgi:hypothetical protein
MKIYRSVKFKTTDLRILYGVEVQNSLAHDLDTKEREHHGNTSRR